MAPEQSPKLPVPPRMVCGRAITTEPRNSAKFRGQTIYFCTEFCLDAFNADPDRFYQAHSKSAQKTDTDEKPEII